MNAGHVEYFQKVGERHRKDFGQFFTHPATAGFMVRWALQSGRKTLFDPAFGLGAFWEPVSRDSEVRFAGSEIDPAILEFWAGAANGRRADIANEDYLLSWGKSHANIVCNPPYMRFQKFFNRSRVFRAFAENLNLRLSGYTNAASAFLLKSLSELNGSGRLAYIMPLEFLNTGYGTLVKKRLVENGHLASIISLDCEKDVFPDATTSVGIILYDAARRRSHVDFHVAASVDSLKNILERPPVSRIEPERLDPESKWLSYFRPKDFVVDAQAAVPLNSYGRFIRGIATGANRFFVLKPSRAEKLGIPASELLPCIARSSQIRRMTFNCEDYRELVKADAAVLLFGAGEAHSEQAESYIREGEREGCSARFLTRSRSPWYKLEKRHPAPLLVGVFSRGGYKIVRNRTEALNLTCFHGFQPNVAGRKHVDHLFLYLASASGRDIVSLSGRRYGDALDKFEPNDLNNALVPRSRLFDELSAGDVAEALAYAEKRARVPDWVDEFFRKLKVAP